MIHKLPFVPSVVEGLVVDRASTSLGTRGQGVR
jgi:hypothetical protein